MLYPNEYTEILKYAWNKDKYSKKIGELPSDEYINQIIHVCYQASLLTEETRSVRFRICYCSEEEATTQLQYNKVKSILKLDNIRELNIKELIRISPAMDPNKAMICIYPFEGELFIWGMLDTGFEWYKYMIGENEGGTPPPNLFTISSYEPGELTATRDGEIICQLKQGILSSPIYNVLHRGPISDFFAESKAKIIELFGDYNHHPYRAYVSFIQRLIGSISEHSHGGTLFFVPDDINNDDSRLKDRLLIKYPCNFNVSWDRLTKYIECYKKYQDLYLSVFKSDAVSAKDIVHSKGELERSENRITEIIKFISSLSRVDGAVIITDKLRVIGFGAEVIASSPSLERIYVAKDSEGSLNNYINIETYGTRHRSAFRFCSSYENSLSFVMSQDGGIKAIKRHGVNLKLWPDINMNPFLLGV